MHPSFHRFYCHQIIIRSNTETKLIVILVTVAIHYDDLHKCRGRSHRRENILVHSSSSCCGCYLSGTEDISVKGRKTFHYNDSSDKLSSQDCWAVSGGQFESKWQNLSQKVTSLLRPEHYLGHTKNSAVANINGQKLLKSL